MNLKLVLEKKKVNKSEHTKKATIFNRSSCKHQDGKNCYCENNERNSTSNLQKKEEPIDEADKVISELREAWAEMLAQNPEGGMTGDQQPGSISLQA